jgi:hypothetical protein
MQCIVHKHGRADRNKGKKRGKIDARSREVDSGDLCRQLGMNTEVDKGNKRVVNKIRKSQYDDREWSGRGLDFERLKFNRLRLRSRGAH